MRTYDTPLRVQPFLVSPSYGQQESLQLRPTSTLVGSLSSLGAELHRHEQTERPVNPVVLQQVWIDGFSVVALTVRTAVVEPQSGRLGASLTIGALFRRSPSRLLVAHFLDVCKRAIYCWTGTDASISSITSRLQPSISLRGSTAVDDLGETVLQLCEERFGFGPERPGSFRAFDLVAGRRRMRKVSTFLSIDRAADDWSRFIRNEVNELVSRDYLEDEDRVACLMIGILTTIGMLLGAFDSNHATLRVIGLVITGTGAMVLMGSTLMRWPSYFALAVRHLRRAGLLILTLLWIWALLARIYLS